MARTGDANVQVREVVQQALREIGRIRETMDVDLCGADYVAPDNSESRVTHLVLRGYLSFEYSLRVLVRLPRVHGNRLAESHSVPELPRKDVPLHAPRGVVVVIVEADLAPPDVARVGHSLETVLCYLKYQSMHTAATQARTGKCAHMSFSTASV